MMDFSKLNSATKYPSIPTLHKLGDRGRLLPELSNPLPEGNLIATEKVDGTNARIVYFLNGPLDYVIGSREELLFARGDRIGNPAEGIVACLRDTAERCRELAVQTMGISGSFSRVVTLYMEVHGGKIGKAAREYTESATDTRFAVFDIAVLHESALLPPVETIALQREGGTLPVRWLPHDELIAETARLDLPRVTEIVTLKSEAFGALESAYGLVKAYCTVPPPGARAKTRMEGLVLRTADRSFIAKARLEDYARTLDKR